MRKFICFLMVLSLIFAQTSTGFAGAEKNEEFIYQDTIEDAYGNLITTVVHETEDKYVIEIYCDDKLDQRVITYKSNDTAVLEQYDDKETLSSINEFDLSEFISPEVVKIATEPIESSVRLMSELHPTDDFTIKGRYGTDYVYQGNILYGDTSTKAKEISDLYRYEAHTLQFSKGTAVGLIVGTLLSIYAGAITVATIAELGIPTVAGVLVDSLTTTVCFTKYRVSTKVSFNGINTVYAGKTYDKVLVSAGAAGSFHYSTSYYGYDIVSSWASTCCSNGAVAFSDKYITKKNPNLLLPIRTIPYNG